MANKQLHELVTSSSTAALQSLGLDITVLSGTDPKTWEEISEYRETKAVITSVKVVNDAAERSFAITSTFNMYVTKTESEMQVVEDNRNRTPDSRKSTLTICPSLDFIEYEIVDRYERLSNKHILALVM